MPGNSRAIVADAERRFPVRIAMRLPPGGLGRSYTAMVEWLDDNCGIKGWSIAPAGVRGVVIDAVAVYVSNPTCAAAFVARWCVPGDPSSFYDLHPDEPDRRVPVQHHKTTF